MITFNFKGNPFPSDEEQERAKEKFTTRLGPLKEEFESNGGTVYFDYSIPPTSSDHCKYTYDLDNYSFILRWAQYENEQREK